MKRDWTEEFKWFHAHPEIGFEEYRTTERIREILKEEGIEELRFPLKTGAVAVIRGEREGNNRLLRADIDALPIKEESNLPYASVHEGVMHACGHDVHLTTALMVADFLNRNKKKVKGNVSILFQPGEEVFNGAASVIKTGITKGIDEFYAFHTDPSSEVGEIGIAAGGVTSSVDRFQITVNGKGSHAALPHEGINPIRALTEIASWLSSDCDHAIDAFTPHVITVARLSAGTTWNVIPSSGELEGTVRTLDENVREKIKNETEKAVRAFELLYDVQISLIWTKGPHVSFNDEGLVKKALSVSKRLGVKTKAPGNLMIGDDFGDYAAEDEKSKGLYIKIGSGKGETYHHPKFYADPKTIYAAAEFMGELLME
ncbi:MAG: amidohydrolase [Lachnospiraceae bacterium]|nr:amidohydrolase [Lachnospiraceae bacterium]